MQIKWWGHACFLIATEHLKILTDPYDESVGYRSINDTVDFVTVSHDHFDHNAVDCLRNKPIVIRSTSGFTGEGIKIRGISSYHDDTEGSQRGDNIVFVMDINGRRICHLGDLGEPLTEDKQKAIGAVDILMVPVGGHFTIDARQAFTICQQLKPHVIIPMHFKTDILDFPIAGVTNFTRLFNPKQVNTDGKSEISLAALPAEQTVYVLDYVR